MDDTESDSGQRSCSTSPSNETPRSVSTHEHGGEIELVSSISQRLIEDTQIEVPTAPPTPTMPAATPHIPSRPSSSPLVETIPSQRNPSQLQDAPQISSVDSFPPLLSLFQTRKSFSSGNDSPKARKSVIEAHKPICAICYIEYSSMNKSDRVVHANACWNVRRSAVRATKGVYAAIQNDLEMLIMRRMKSSPASYSTALPTPRVKARMEDEENTDYSTSLPLADPQIDPSCGVLRARICLIRRALLGTAQHPRSRKRVGSFKEKKDQGMSRAGGINGAGYKSAKTRLRNGQLLVLDDDGGTLLEATYVRYTFLPRSARIQFLRFLRRTFNVLTLRVYVALPEAWRAQQVDVTKTKLCGSPNDTAEDDDNLPETDARNLREMQSLNLDGAGDVEAPMLGDDKATDPAGVDNNRVSFDEANFAEVLDLAENSILGEEIESVRNSSDQKGNTSTAPSSNHLQALTGIIGEKDKDSASSKHSASEATLIEMADAIPISGDSTTAYNTTSQTAQTRSPQPLPTTSHSRGLSSSHAFDFRRNPRHVRFLSTPPALHSPLPRPRPAFPAFPPPGIPLPTTTQGELDAVLADVIYLPGIVTSKL